MKIGYARVSTDEQNLDLQIDALSAAGCEAIYTDEGISGITKKRDGLSQALSAIKKETFWLSGNWIVCPYLQN